MEVAIGSPVIKNRNGALNVLESWVSNSERPLVKVSPNLYQLLTKVVDNEPDESVHNRMELLLSGKINSNKVHRHRFIPPDKYFEHCCLPQRIRLCNYVNKNVDALTN